MIIKRKLFASQQNPQPQEVEQDSKMSSRDIQLEQMKLQRQLMQTQRMKQRMQAEERRDEAKRLMQQQKLEQQRDREEQKQRISIKRQENNDNVNTSLYKSKSHPVAPVPMKH